MLLRINIYQVNVTTFFSGHKLELEKNWTGNREEREGITCRKGPQGGIEPAAARTRPLPTELPGRLNKISFWERNLR